MFNFLFKRWKPKPPTDGQLRRAKKLGIKSAAEMSRKTLDAMIADAERKRAAERKLDKLGWTYEKPRASMFVWASISDAHLKGQGSIDFCLRMMDEAEVSLSPGRAFGEHGENCVRIALVENEHRLRQAMRNLDRAPNPRTPKPKRERAVAK
jgi:aspartate/methionine/tyrosine aminotransferase